MYWGTIMCWSGIWREEEVAAEFIAVSWETSRDGEAQHDRTPNAAAVTHKHDSELRESKSMIWEQWRWT